MLTPHARWQAALHLEPVDRLPFWPKFDGAYLHAHGAALGAASVVELHAFVGSDPHLGVGGCTRQLRTTTAFSTEGIGTERVQRYHTPAGDLQAVHRFDAASQSWHPVEFPIKRVEDLATMTAWFADAQVALDAEALDGAREAVAGIGERASTMASLGESPLMYFVEWLAGVEGAHFFLADAPDAVETLFAAMHRVLRQEVALAVAHHPADLLYLVENTSTTLISPAQYRAYCLPYLMDYALLAQEAGRDLCLHMCGHLKALLPDLATLPVRAFEAYTTPPVGNATLREGRLACPQVCLIGGTNATWWLEPAGAIIAHLEAALAELPHQRGLVITSGGVMPPACAPETVREVCRWVQTLGARSS
jgi:uroporphyrinogen-III decarboxylase